MVCVVWGHQQERTEFRTKNVSVSESERNVTYQRQSISAALVIGRGPNQTSTQQAYQERVYSGRFTYQHDSRDGDAAIVGVQNSPRRSGIRLRRNETWYCVGGSSCGFLVSHEYTLKSSVETSHAYLFAKVEYVARS